MTNHIEAMKLAVHKINQATALDEESDELLMEALAALRQQISEAEQVEQEPVAWLGYGPRDGRPEFSVSKPASSVLRDFKMRPLAYCDAAPPQREWVSLTDEDWKEIEDMPDTFDQGVAWANAKLKEKNCG